MGAGLPSPTILVTGQDVSGEAGPMGAKACWTDGLGSTAMIREAILRQVTSMISIRPVEPGDSPDWLRMRQALWPEYDPAWHAEQVRQFFAGLLTMPLAALVAVKPSGEIIGFVELSIRSYAEDCQTDRVAYLEGWYVDPGERRQGIGTALMKAAEDWGRAQGCREFGSDAVIDNLVSASAHLALGFQETVQLRCFRKDL